MNIQLQPQRGQEVDIDKPMSTEEQLEDLKLKVDSMSQMFFMLRKLGLEKKEKENSEELDAGAPLINKDGIPINTCFVGYTKKSPHPYILVVNEKGQYMLGTKMFDSLSAAAEFVSGVRRSGWTFWCTLEGDTVKDIYKQD